MSRPRWTHGYDVESAASGSAFPERVLDPHARPDPGCAARAHEGSTSSERALSTRARDEIDPSRRVLSGHVARASRRDIESALARLASSQCGLITRAQAREAGLSVS